jgi:hypothetical protein
MLQNGLGVGNYASIQSLSLAPSSVVPGPLPEIESGLIVHWVGRVNQIPSGWALCDGAVYSSLFALGLTNPNCKGRIARCPNHTGSGGSFGGSDSHSHTFSTLVTSIAGNHNHTGNTGLVGTHDHTGSTQFAGQHNHSGLTDLVVNHNHTGITGAGTAHNHGVSNIISNEWGHLHTAVPGITTANTTVVLNVDLGLLSVASNLHAHNMSLSYVAYVTHNHTFTIGQITNNENAHTHNINDNGEHQHSIDMEISHIHTITNEPSHQHTIGNDGSHTHNVDGNSDNSNSIPESIELHFIIKL